MLQSNGSYLKVCALVLVSSQGFQVFMRISFVEFQRVTLNHYFTQSNFGTKGATCWVHYLGASSLRCLSKLLQPGFLCHSCLSYAFILTISYSCVFILTVYLRCLSWQSSIPLCLFWLFILYVYLDNVLFFTVLSWL